jgi:hypothetical protein
MAKESNPAALATPDLFGVPARRGRPRSACSMTNAERQAKFRNSRKALVVGEQISATIKRLARDFDLTEDQVTRELLRFSLCNRNWSKTGFSGVSK